MPISRIVKNPVNSGIVGEGEISEEEVVGEEEVSMVCMLPFSSVLSNQKSKYSDDELV